jgi:DNA-3-methyladenine glycosylase
MKLRRSFFAKSTLKVAEELVGKVLVRKYRGREIRARILETEAYVGEEDLACHARHGKTPRNNVMYGRAGFAYIYLCYGLHALFNIVTEKDGFPAAVLVRKINPLSGLDPELKSYGPGNVARYLKINLNFNREDLAKSGQLWVEDDGFKPNKICRAKRVGVAYAGSWANKNWRFILEAE